MRLFRNCSDKFIVVGDGFVGSMFAANVAKSVPGFNLRMLGNRNVDAQDAWGIVCARTLQSEYSRIAMPNPVDGIKENVLKQFGLSNKDVGLRHDPMYLLANSVNSSWKQATKYSDAEILSSCDLATVGINYPGFGLQCASSDAIVNQSLLINQIKDGLEWKYPKQFELTDCIINSLEFSSDDSITTINTTSGVIDVAPNDKVFIALGGMTEEVLNRNLNILRLHLPYSNIAHCALTNNLTNIGAIWHPDFSCVTHSEYLRFGSGFQNMFQLPNSGPELFDLARKGLWHTPNLFRSKDSCSFVLPSQVSSKQHEIMQLAYNSASEVLGCDVNELAAQNSFHPEIKSCAVDVTPTLSPIILQGANWLSVCGLSGSGLRAADSTWNEAILQTLQTGIMTNILRPFSESQSVLCPDPRGVPGISASRR